MKTHKVFSASSASRWLACPGSVAAASAAPAPAASDYADEGTAAHLVAEYCLRFDCPPGEAEVMVNGKPYPVDDELAEAVSAYVSLVRDAGGTLLIEKEVLIAPDLGGTVDAGIIDRARGIVHVVDFKYGRRAVDVRQNPQLTIYAAGLLQEFPGAKVIRRTICQPRVSPPVSTVDVSADEFRSEVRDLMAGYEAAKSPDAPRHAGSHCRYCPALASCREHRAMVATTVGADFDLASKTPISLPAVEKLDNTQLARVMDLADLLTEYAKAVKAEANTRMMRGQKIPGWKVVEKRANREWIDAAKTSQALGAILGSAAYTVPELLSPAQMEKALKSAGADPSIVADLAHKPAAGLSIAPESDKRKEVVPESVDDFSA